MSELSIEGISATGVTLCQLELQAVIDEMDAPGRLSVASFVRRRTG
jgi:hypothetical protein